MNWWEPGARIPGRLNIGDAVKIKRDIHHGWYNGILAVDDMRAYGGRWAKIVRVCNLSGITYYKLDIDHNNFGGWNWTAEMFEVGENVKKK